LDLKQLMTEKEVVSPSVMGRGNNARYHSHFVHDQKYEC